MKGLKMSKCNNRVAFWENISYNSFILKVLDNLNKIRGSKAPAFTLTEVLLAVLIVGIIAALVLPAVVTKYQDKAFESAFNREVHSLQDSIDSLAAVENQQSFYETTLAKTPETYMKKYLRVSKYCGTSGKDCFGKFYSEYSGHEKKTYTPSYDGNCAILKNGTSVCLNVNGGSIDMLIDVNGPKGPNVFGRDLRTYTHSVKGITGYDMSSNGIISLNQTPIGSEDEPDPCEGKTCGCGSLPPCETGCSSDPNKWDVSCCKLNKSSISRGHHCCSFEDIKNSVPECFIVVNWNMFFNEESTCDKYSSANCHLVIDGTCSAYTVSSKNGSSTKVNLSGYFYGVPCVETTSGQTLCASMNTYCNASCNGGSVHNCSTNYSFNPNVPAFSIKRKFFKNCVGISTNGYSSDEKCSGTYRVF